MKNRKKAARKLKTKGKKGLPILSELTEDDHWEVRKEVARSLKYMLEEEDLEEAVNHLQDLTNDKRFEVKKLAVNTLENQDKDSEEFEAEL